jgi:kinetochore protein Spc7/SPC105
LTLLNIKYPVDIKVVPSLQGGPPAFKATAMVLFPFVKAKAFISFVFAAETFCYWPMSISSLGYEVEVIYGTIE